MSEIDVVKVALEWGAWVLTWSWENLSSLMLALLILWVKHDVNEKTKITDKRYALKYQACMDALTVIDAQYSHFKWSVKNSCGNNEPLPEPAKQWLTPDFVRSCHSALFITCSEELLDQFSKIMFEDTGGEDMTVLLHEFRKLICVELGFENEAAYNRKYTWFSSGPFVYEDKPSQS